jgi:tetratricopeptide (TPR) repeat protein
MSEVEDFELPITVEVPPEFLAPPEIDPADELRERGDLEGLVELYLGRVQAATGPAQRALLLAQVARVFEHELDDAERALAALVASYHEAPGEAAWHELSRLATAAGAWDRLEAELGETLESLPAEVRVGLFRRWEKWAALADALEERAFEVDASDARALRAEAARLYADVLDEPELAIARYQGLLAEASDDAELRRTLAGLYRQEALSDEAQAERWWSALLAIEPDAEDALRALARGYRAAGRRAELRATLERLAARAPAPELLIEIAELCEREPDRARAVDAWRAAEAVAPTHPSVLAALARAAQASGALDEALQLCDRRALLAEGTPAELPLVLEGAALCERLDDPRGTEARLLRALEIDPAHRGALSSLAALLDRRGADEAALARHLQVLALAPDDAAATARAVVLLWGARRYEVLVPIRERATAAGERAVLVGWVESAER